jgi:hypothetical protein
MWMMTAALGPRDDVSRLNTDAASTAQALIPGFCAKMVQNGLWRIRTGIRLVSPSCPQMLVERVKFDACKLRLPLTSTTPNRRRDPRGPGKRKRVYANNSSGVIPR